MDKGHKLIVFLLILSLTVGGGHCTAIADDDGHREKHRYQKRERKHSEENGQCNLPIVSDPAYTENCGACHFAYQPGSLPLAPYPTARFATPVLKKGYMRTITLRFHGKQK